MKIAAIALSTVPSNTANSIQAMKACHALAQVGHTVTLLLPGVRPAVSGAELCAHYGIKEPFDIDWLSASSRRLFTWQAARRARALGADLLYAWPLQSAVFGLLQRLPVVIEMHDLPSGLVGPFWYRGFLRIPGRKRIAVITHALETALDSRYGKALPARDVIVAPNGVEPERFADLPAPAAARRQIGLREAPTVACTGHLYAGRGVELFLSLAQNHPEAQFLWAGGRTQDVERWRTAARESGCVNVTFAGFVPNERLPLYQAAADILLMPYGRTIEISSGGGNSAAISSPMKMFEYMAAGRAIIASDLPVIHEILGESSAVFCPPDDAAVWGTAVTALLGDAARREALGAQARRDSLQYSWTARARRILDKFPDNS